MCNPYFLGSGNKSILSAYVLSRCSSIMRKILDPLCTLNSLQDQFMGETNIHTLFSDERFCLPWHPQPGSGDELLDPDQGYKIGLDKYY